MRCTSCHYMFTDKGYRSSEGNIVCPHCGSEVIEKPKASIDNEIEKAKAEGREQGRKQAIAEVRAAALGQGTLQPIQSSLSPLDRILSSIPHQDRRIDNICGVGSGAGLIENAQNRAAMAERGENAASFQPVQSAGGSRPAGGINQPGESLVEDAKRRAQIEAQKQGKSLEELTRA